MKTRSENQFGHTPVLLNPVIEGLYIRPDGIYLDGTLGRAGHAKEILKYLTSGKLIAVDRDSEAIDAASEILAPWNDKIILIHGNFADLDQILSDVSSQYGIVGVDGMLFDLGVSSPQIDNPARGFSYQHDAPLDMRMDITQALTARDIVNFYGEFELKNIFYQYGEERYAPQIARAIVRYRESDPDDLINTTGELVNIIKSAMPARALREKQHPAKRVFQALRIAVNGELDALNPMIRSAAKYLNPGGRLAIITFHSLEDKIIKQSNCPKAAPVRRIFRSAYAAKSRFCVLLRASRLSRTKRNWKTIPAPGARN